MARHFPAKRPKVTFDANGRRRGYCLGLFHPHGYRVGTCDKAQLGNVLHQGLDQQVFAFDGQNPCGICQFGVVQGVANILACSGGGSIGD